MTIDEINELTVDDVVIELLVRMVDINVPEGETAFMFLDGVGSAYERLTVHSSIVKPTLEAFQSELTDYKNELITIEQNRVTELARVEDIKTRWAVMSDVRAALSKTGIEIANPQLELKRIIEENDQSTLVTLEAQYAIHLAEQDVKSTRKARKEMGKQARQVCEDVLDLIAGFNLERTLTPEQISTMQATFSSTELALRANRPWTAKALIEAITPDESLVTTDMKSDLLAEFVEAGI